MEINNVGNEILKILDDKKAENIVVVDTSNDNSRMSDFCIIASGTSSRHMQALADLIYRHLKELKQNPHIEGNAKSGWVLIESAGIEVHMFKPDIREYYNIEELLSFKERQSQE